MNHKSLFGGMMLLSISFGAEATVLFSDNFDSYANQAAFQAAWTTPVGTGGQLTSTNFVSPGNSIRFDTAALRNDHTFTESGNPSALNAVSFSFNFYDSNAGASPYRQVSSLIDGAGSASGQLVSLGLNNNQSSSDGGGNYYMARILGYTVTTSPDPDGGSADSGTLGAGAFFKLNDYGVGLRSTGWHNLGVTITDTTFSFFVDGVLAESVANTVTLRSYDSVRIGSGITAANFFGVDDVLVQVNPIPEPGVFGLAALSMGAFALIRYFRK
jgi:hypothetical protein